MPYVELLADNDLDPAALAKVDGLNLVGAAGRLKPMKGFAHPLAIFPKFVCPLPVRVAGENSQPISLCTFPPAPSGLRLNGIIGQYIRNWLLAQSFRWK